MTCYDSSGGVISCADTGQDGDIRAGTTLDYTDNGDTITDNNTELEWEKKTASNVGTTYTWVNAFAYIDSLTRPTFAGHNDWRLPNAKELQSIVDYGRFNPSIDPMFAPMAASFYWWSTTSAVNPVGAWSVGFGFGGVGVGDKGFAGPIRAVRGGSP